MKRNSWHRRLTLALMGALLVAVSSLLTASVLGYTIDTQLAGIVLVFVAGLWLLIAAGFASTRSTTNKPEPDLPIQ